MFSPRCPKPQCSRGFNPLNKESSESRELGLRAMMEWAQPGQNKYLAR
jgi:hypothetical protein